MSRDRSRSNTRDRLMSTGRGGAGNLVRSVSQEPGEDVRGRELSPKGEILTHTGRGGAGNVRSPSRDPAASKIAEEEATLENRLVKEHRNETTVHSSGRGGLGNITRSRSPAAREPKQTSGRGGAGNMHPDGEVAISERPDASDATVAAEHHKAEQGASHSTGRGGDGNITTAQPPTGTDPVEAVSWAHAHSGPEVHSSGRGGAGNIHFADQTKGDEVDNERGRKHHKGFLGGLVEKMSSKSRERGTSKE